MINNDVKVVAQIEALGLEGVEAWADDGSVGVEVNGSEDRRVEVAKVLYEKFGDVHVGDGVQDSWGLWVNWKDENGVHRGGDEASVYARQ